jgi:ABC-type branched-subunit amino acid transport system permease subunit
MADRPDTVDVQQSTAPAGLATVPSRAPARSPLIEVALPSLIVAVIILVLPLFIPSFVSSLVAKMMIYGLFGMSLNIIWGYAGIPSFGHAAFFGVGGYAVAILILKGA